MAITTIRGGPIASNGTTAVTAYTGTNGPDTILTITVANTNTTTVKSITVSLETTTSLAAADQIISAVPIGPKSSVVFRGPWILATDEDVIFKLDQSGTDVTVTVAGVKGA